MRCLVLVSCLAALLALACARAATLAHPDTFEKKLEDAVKEVLDKDSKIPTEELEQSNTIKDTDNQLLKHVAAEPIPVKIVVEDVQPALKTKEDVEKAEDDAADIKRVEVDLKHPGEPQRQEHETQNPEHFEDEEGALASVKQLIRNTQVVFNDGFKEVSERIEDWLKDNKPEISIQNSIENLQETFMENVNKLNSTIQSYWNQASVEKPEKQVDIQKVQSSLKVLEEKFESGVETLNNGVRNLAVQKTETRDDATTTAKPSGIQFPGFVTNFWNSVTQSIGNVTNQFQSVIGQGNSTAQAAGIQSDETSASTSKPSVFQAIQNQIQGIFQGRPQGAQNDEQPSQPNGPFAQVIQNVPLLQNFVNFIQPNNKPAATQTAPQPAQSTNSEGTNVVPAEPANPDQQQKKPDQDAQPAQPTQPQPQRPIQQIIQKNPVVQGIAGAIQKIQHTISNPEKPREEAEKGVEKEGDEKAGFIPWHGGHRPGEGDNQHVGVSGIEKSAPAEAEKPAPEAEKPAPEAEKPAPVAVKPLAEAESPAPAAPLPEAEKPAPAALPAAA